MTGGSQATGRLIPAHAGKTGSRPLGRYRLRAHPRSRGENAHARASASWPAGSSPLTRGKRVEAELLRLLEGLIPAHAGKTPWWVPSSPCLWAHPRSRGENIEQNQEGFRSTGSSPLTRGKPREGQQACGLRRLIPAHAGKTIT